MAEKSKAEEIKEKVIKTLQKIFDPELPVNIYELGLIYDIKVNEINEVEILMTLTAPNCPEAGAILEQVNRDVGNLHDVTNVTIDLTFDPPWDREMLSEAAKLELGLL